MTSPWAEVRQVLAPNRRNLGALGAVALLLAGTHLVLPALALPADVVAGAQYGAWLATFAVWMAWFVFAGVALWRAGGE